MKKMLLFSMLLLLLLGTMARADNGPTFWALGDYNVTGFRVGYQWAGKFEAGGLSYWRLWETEDVPQTYGGYLLYHLPGEFDISQIPILAPLAELLPSLASYIGIQGAIEINDDNSERGFVGPVAGAVLQKFIFDTVDDQIETVTEVQWVRYTDKLERQIGDDEFRVTFGLRIYFPRE